MVVKVVISSAVMISWLKRITNLSCAESVIFRCEKLVIIRCLKTPILNGSQSCHKFRGDDLVTQTDY